MSVSILYLSRIRRAAVIVHAMFKQYEAGEAPDGGFLNTTNAHAFSSLAFLTKKSKWNNKTLG